MIPFHPFLKNLLALVLLALVSVVAYSNALRSDFFMDDTWMFDQDRVSYVQAKVESVFFHKPIPEKLQDYDLNLSRRPLSQLIPLANHMLFKNNVLAYHTVSLILFILCAFMIFAFLKIISQNFFISLTASLLFAIHPINNLMVNYISAQTFSVQLIFMISSCLAYFSYHKNPGNFLSLSASLVLFYLAVLCHESALALPLFLTALSLTVLQTNFKNTTSKLWPFYGISLILGVLWFLKSSTLAQNPPTLSPAAYIAGLVQLETWYVSKLFFPNGILMMYVIPAEKISLIVGWLTLFAMTAALILTKHLWIKNKFMILALSWFGIGFLLVAAGGKFQSEYGITIEPHWLYFSSLGLFLMAGQGLDALRKYHARLPLLTAALLVIACVFSTFRLNAVWADQFRYAKYWAEHNPDFLKTQLILGDMYFNKQQYQEAEQSYLSVIGQIKTDDKYLSQLGRIAEIEKRFDDAIGYYEKALVINPENPKTLSNLAIIYIKTDKLDRAEKLLLKAIALNPGMLPLRINLSIVYEKQDRSDEALQLLWDNLEISPEDSQTHSALTRLMLKQQAAP